MELLYAAWGLRTIATIQLTYCYVTFHGPHRI